MNFYYIYEWTHIGWFGIGWKSSQEACTYIKMRNIEGWYAIYSSNPITLIGNAALNHVQAYSAMCGGYLMPAGIAVPGFSGCLN